MRLFQKILILSHRYIGIPLSFMFVLWFASAFVMIYAGGMPRITPEMRIESAESLNFSEVNIPPTQLIDIAGFSPSAVTLKTILGRPVYELQELGLDSLFIYADNGEILTEFTQEQAQQLASDFLDIPVEQFNFEGILSRVDQWTLTSRRALPLHKFIADDELGTEAYVSPVNLNVTVYTTSQSRMLAWLGTIPHWLYFTSLRFNQPLWYDIVVWSSGIGCILAIMGLFLGVTQFRRTRPFNLTRAIPYQGWLRWHYIFGSVFGVVTLTWVFSGLLSMEPFAWTNARGLEIDDSVYIGGELDISEFPATNAQEWAGLFEGDIKEIEYRWIQGQPYFLANYSATEGMDKVKRERLHQPYYVMGQAESNSILIDAASFRIKESFAIDDLVSQLDDSISAATVVEYELLQQYDDYYYSRNNQVPLPILRIKFDDPVSSWVYVDPAKSQLITMVHQWSRLERWLYNGLHSLDFAFWYHKRPLWDIGVIFLLTGGLLSSLTGLYFGLRRLKNDVGSLFKQFVKVVK